MAARNAAIFAIYPNHASAEAGVNALKARGVSVADISVVAPHVTPAAPPAGEPGEAAAVGPVPAASGSGHAIGNTVAFLVGVGTVAVAGAAVVVAGPVLAAFKGMSDAVLGVVDALARFGVPADDAKKYEARVRDGAILVSIHAHGTAEIATGKAVFEQTGAEDISSIYGAAQGVAAAPAGA